MHGAVYLDDMLAARREGVEPFGEYARMYEAATDAAESMLADAAEIYLGIAHLDDELDAESGDEDEDELPVSTRAPGHPRRGEPGALLFAS